MSSSVVELPNVTGTCPEFLSAAVRRAVRSGGSWQETADRVAAALRGRLPGPGLLSPRQLVGDPSGYQTHLIHAEPDGSFSILVMVWLPGQTTPVHDHLSWCVTAVLQGTEYEEVYRVVPGGPQRFPGALRTPKGAPGASRTPLTGYSRASSPRHRGDRLEVVARNANPVGTVSGFAPPGDIHRVTNVGDSVAVSMHVYGTDITRVGSSVRRVYDLPVR